MLVFHPSTEVAIGHQNHENFVNIMPGPIALEIPGLLCQVVHREFIANFEEGTGTFVYIGPAVFFG
jgi:hypothetical protein